MTAGCWIIYCTKAISCNEMGGYANHKLLLAVRTVFSTSPNFLKNSILSIAGNYPWVRGNRAAYRIHPLDKNKKGDKTKTTRYGIKIIYRTKVFNWPRPISRCCCWCKLEFKFIYKPEGQASFKEWRRFFLPTIVSYLLHEHTTQLDFDPLMENFII